MAGYNPSDIGYSVIKETVAGTTPTTGALQRIPHIPGSGPTFTSDVLESAQLSKGRQAGGTRKAGYRSEGQLKTHFARNAATNLLLESALSATFVEAGDVGDGGDTLKGSDQDVSFSMEKRVSGAPNLFSTFKGMQVSKFTLTVDASSNAEATWDFIGMDRATATTPSALTYVDAADTLKLAGPDVNNVSITGLPGLQFRSLELSVEQTKEARDAFGATKAIGIGTSGNRKVTLNLTFYRADLQPEAILGGNAEVAVSFTIGTGADAYTFTLPKASASIPQDVEDASKYLVQVEFTAGRDNASDTDIIVTRS